MTPYRRIITVTLVLATVVAVIANFLQQQQQAVLFASILLAEALGDAAATAYLAWLSKTERSRPRSWLLLFLVVGAFLITLAFWVIGFLVILRSFGLTLPPGLGANITGTALILVGAVPVMKASLFYLVQRDPTVDGGIPADVANMQRALADATVAQAIAANDLPRAAREIVVCLQRYLLSPEAHE